jgi:hypothetical protein
VAQRHASRWKAGLHGLIALAVFFTALGVAGFAAMWLMFGGVGRWSDDPGRKLADRIRAADSPLVREVVFRQQTIIDPPEVHVIVDAGMTEWQAEQLWCDIVAPAGGSQFEGELGALIYDDAGKWLASGTECPSPQPGATASSS